MRVAVIGSKGMLARDVVSALAGAGIPCWERDLPDLDVTQSDHVLLQVEGSGATVVVNCAAYTAVDKAESQPDVAFAVNRDGVRNLALACKTLDIPLIHISTDYVFDGELRRPYREEDPPMPLGVYGASKWAGENELRTIHEEHVILRTSWLFGAQGHSFVKTILRLAQERDVLRVVNDQYGCPTWTCDLADVLIKLLRATTESRERDGLWGTYHCCGLGETTWWGFANEIVKCAKALTPLKAVTVTPISTTDFPTPARRPQSSVLDCGKIEQQLGFTRKSWKDGVAIVVRDLLSQTGAGHL